MKRASILFAALCLSTTASFAASLPVSGTFGDDAGCIVLAQGESQNTDWILVSPKTVSGHEWECSASKVRGTKVALRCGEAGDNGKGRIVNVTVAEDHATDVLTYTDPDGTLTLHRCK